MRSLPTLGGATLALAAGMSLGHPAAAAPCPTVMPVAGEKSSPFGAARGGRGHGGTDIRAPIGSVVLAAAGGVVTFLGRFHDYGLMVEIMHSDGSRARYAHLARFAPGLSAGDAIRAGQDIGILGRTGRTTGPNLHVELRREGRPVDPWPWLTRAACTEYQEVAEAPDTPSR
ncbi:M23 family peptidase [Falsiroseomonas bella]|uniref:M23 family peptidase n=1 Tax=Falsiroseomonas bella TaxID=2184016 RepID=A0A317FC30_9PROT|nr:M23 family metallopeptidase [Falsiroseomonas bella]PWS36053.1 M23 family peptidase [Falsiroseomonas bella]